MSEAIQVLEGPNKTTIHFSRRRYFVAVVTGLTSALYIYSVIAMLTSQEIAWISADGF